MNRPEARTGLCVEGRRGKVLSVKWKLHFGVWNEANWSLKGYGQSSLHSDYIVQTYQSEIFMVILQEYILQVIFLMVQ